MYKIPPKNLLVKCTINPITILKEKFVSLMLKKTQHKIANNIQILYSKHGDMFAIRLFLISIK